MDDVVCGLVMGEAKSDEAADGIAETFKNCPYVAFIAPFSKMVAAAFLVPREQMWWLKGIEEKPKETLGLEKAVLYTTSNSKYPKAFEARVPEKRTELSPCGVICSDCPGFDRCLRCPGTVHYRGER